MNNTKVLVPTLEQVIAGITRRRQHHLPVEKELLIWSDAWFGWIELPTVTEQVTQETYNLSCAWVYDMFAQRLQKFFGWHSVLFYEPQWDTVGQRIKMRVSNVRWTCIWSCRRACAALIRGGPFKSRDLNLLLAKELWTTRRDLIWNDLKE